MNVNSTASAAAAPVASNVATPVPAAATSTRNTTNLDARAGIPVLGTPSPEGSTPTGSGPVDRIELSSKGLKLALSRSLEETAREQPPEPAPEPEPVEAAPEEPTALLGKESTWESERTAKLDRLEILVRQGQYKIDPFMLDEIAVRMARLMV